MKPLFPQRKTSGFTLIELLTVIAIIAVLMGLLFPAVGAVKDAARKAQAKNDMVQIVNATKLYYTEYGKYPLLPSEQGGDITFGEFNPTIDNLMNVLRRTGQGRDNPNPKADNLNPRRIVFLETPLVKDSENPRGGINPNDGRFYDPWGKVYIIRVDGNYDNKVANPYNKNAGFKDVETGVIVWSLGKDRKGGSGDKKEGEAADDVISWQ